MRTTNCKHYDFTYTTYEGERRIYCAKHGGNQPCDVCKECKDKGKEMNNTPLPYRIVAKILRRNGFLPIPKSRGSHEKWIRGESESLIVRITGMNRMIWRRLVKEHKLIHVDGTDYRK